MSYIIAIGAYLVLLMIYGLVIAHKKVKTTDDMMTGGHKIPFIILVGSLLATWCGGGGITGSAGVVYTGGPWVGALAYAAPPIGIILLYFIAGRVRKTNKVTVPEIMGARYGAAASVISALCVMLAYVGVLATQLKAAADILVLLCHSSGIEISHGVALAICTVIIVIITVRRRQRPDHDRRLLPGHSHSGTRGQLPGRCAASREGQLHRRPVWLDPFGLLPARPVPDAGRPEYAAALCLCQEQ